MMVHGIKMKDTLANKKNEKSRMLGIKECEYFSKLIFKSLFSIHDKIFSLWLNSSNV